MTGYATFNYEESEYRVADLIKVVICVNGDPCDPLSFVSHSSKVTTTIGVSVFIIVVIIIIMFVPKIIIIVIIIIIFVM